MAVADDVFHSFPSASGEDIGRGSPYSRGAQELIDFALELGFTGVQLGPQGETTLGPISLVCKLMTVDGRPAVKLSDNFQKALGPVKEVERYRRVFGMAGVADTPVIA